MTLYVCTRDMCNAVTIAIEHSAMEAYTRALLMPPQVKGADAVLQVDKEKMTHQREIP